MPSTSIPRKHTSTLVSLIAICIGMFGLAYGSVPLYRLFCQVTGFGGATQVADSAPDVVLDRMVNVYFNADTGRDLPWRFRPLQKDVDVHIGESKLIFYEATNTSDRPVTGTSVYNVTPLKVGGYFNKVECFCFEEQTINPGETVTFPVSFFIDPDIVNDRNLNDVNTITLSYTFFEVKKPS